ncbi:MAG: DUF1997 domain-containing protein [Elainellaceae cyanobacterium]
MQANSANHRFDSTSDSVLEIAALDMTTNLVQPERYVPRESSQCEVGASLTEETCFRGHFGNSMAMYADAALVAQYLDNHPDWFRRCAQPMAADPIGATGYTLTIGKFGSFGYEVEPKVGLDLLPQDEGVYRIRTIEVPGYEPAGYDVDFRASLELAEREVDSKRLSDGCELAQRGSRYTSVEWELDLKVTIHFPRFIQALPHALIQSTGDRLLQQIVQQVSKRLTLKVQEDFHATMGIPFTQKRRRALWS